MTAETTVCPHCGDENSYNVDDFGQLYCTCCDEDIHLVDDIDEMPEESLEDYYAAGEECWNDC